MRALQATSVINHKGRVELVQSSFPEQWWTVPTCCAHVLYTSAQQETALDWTPLIIENDDTATFLFFSLGFPPPSTEADINEVKRKMILPTAFRERGELGQWFILPQKHSCVHPIRKQERARSRGRICSCFHGPLAALTAWPWAGKEEKQPEGNSSHVYWIFSAWELINWTNLLAFNLRWLILDSK